MGKEGNETHVPVVVTPQRDGSVDLYIPDMEVTIHGKNYVDVYAKTVMVMTSYSYFCVERNIDFSFKADYSEVEAALTKKRRNKSFATFIPICL